MTTGSENASYLRHLCLILGSSCNLACDYCYQNARKKRSISWAYVEAAINAILRSKERKLEISFTGGEPLLQFDTLQRAVEYTQSCAPEDKEIEYSISTNGLLVTDKILEFMAVNRFETQLSFDGVPGAQNHRKPGTFRFLDTLLDRIKNDYNQFFSQYFSVAYTLIPAGIPHLANSIEYFTGKDIRHIKLAPVLTDRPEWSDNMAEELDIQMEKVFGISLEHYENTGRVPLNIFRGKFGDDICNSADGALCGAPSAQSIAVDTDGEVYGCSVFARSYQEFTTPFMTSCSNSLSIGHINSPDFTARLAGMTDSTKELKIFHHRDRKYSSYGKCSDCSYLPQCTICPASIAHIPGNSDPRRIPDFPCAFNRSAMKYRALFPARQNPGKLLEGPPGVEDQIRWWRELAGSRNAEGIDLPRLELSGRDG